MKAKLECCTIAETSSRNYQLPQMELSLRTYRLRPVCRWANQYVTVDPSILCDFMA